MDFYCWVRGQPDRTVGLLAAVAGALAIVIGWFGVSNGVVPSQQIPYLASGAVGGLFLLGVGATLWLSADMRDEWHKLDELLDELRRDREIVGPTEADEVGLEPAAPTPNGGAPRPDRARPLARAGPKPRAPSRRTTEP